MEDEDDILYALQDAVVAAVAQSDAPGLAVKYIGLGFEEPDSQEWLELVWLPNTPVENRDNSRHHQGILRLILHWPNDTSGAYRPLRLLGSVTRYFVKGMVLSGVQIYISPQSGGVIENGEEVLLPCSIQYRSYRQN